MRAAIALSRESLARGPSPRPSRSASEVARSRLRGLPHAPQSQPCFFTTTSLLGSSYSPAVTLFLFLVSKSGSRPSWSRCCCCCCLLLLLPTTSVLKRREMLARSEGLARVRVRPRRGRRAALASWQGCVSTVFHMRRTSSHEPRYQYTAICYCCWASCRTCFPQTA